MSVEVVILAGGLRQFPLQRALGFPPPGLPLAAEQSLLSAWLERLSTLPLSGPAVLACSTESDQSWFSAELRRTQKVELDVESVVDPRQHRGTCGVIADHVHSRVCTAEWILIVEVNALPPASLDAIRDALDWSEDAAVGVSRDMQPSGVYLFRRAALDAVPKLGYCDLKEQFIARLVASGGRIRPITLDATAIRLNDRKNYLRALRVWQSITKQPTPPLESPNVAGHSLVCHGCRVDPSAFIKDAVILPGAEISAGSVVARSVVGPMMIVPEGAMLVDTTFATPTLKPGVGFAVESTPSRATQTPRPSWSH